MSTTIDEARKKEISSVLKVDFMSSKDSEYEDVTTPSDEDSSGSELEDSTSSKRRKDWSSINHVGGAMKCRAWWKV